MILLKTPFLQLFSSSAQTINHAMTNLTSNINFGSKYLHENLFLKF